MNSTISQGVAYDAVVLLGFGAKSAEPLPEPAPGEIVIRYGSWVPQQGWSLQGLRDEPMLRMCNIMWEQDWYNDHAWSNEILPDGIYRLRVPVPGSNRKTFAEQQAMLSPGEQVAPVVLVATALLVHYAETGEDLLKNDWTRCKEETADGGCVALSWREGRLRVYDCWDDNRYDGVWLSSLRTS
jgi:hypothetical protein